MMLGFRKRIDNSMKRKLFTIICMAMAMSASAESVTAEQASEKATAFFESLGHARGTRATEQPRLQLVEFAGVSGFTRASAQPAYYIFNRTDGDGFVIVSAESEAPDILAYSESNTFDAGAPENGAWVFLGQYEALVEGIRNRTLLPQQAAWLDAQKRVQTRADEWEAYCQTALLNQRDGNWENYTPYKEGNKTAPAGCVATAMTILMHYYQWPDRGRGSNAYESETYHLKLSHDFSKDTYDWASIPFESYKSGTWSAKACDEVPKIMLSCGIALNMDYDLEGSATQFSRIGWYNHFQYARAIRCMQCSSGVNSTHAANIKSELDEKRIVPVAARGKRGAHAFILDGYNGDYFHANFGWGGNDNGWYLATNMSTSDAYLVTSYYMGFAPLSGRTVWQTTKGGLKYQIIDDGTLEISGNGSIAQGFLGSKENEFNTMTNRLIYSCAIGEGVSSLGKMAFYELRNMENVVIGPSVQSIEPDAFLCTTPKRVSVSEQNTKFDSREDCNAVIETATNTLYRGFSTTVIPTSVTSIGTSAFSDREDLTSIRIPNSVVTIGKSAFGNCVALEKVEMGQGVRVIESSAFRHCDVLESIELPSTLESAGSYAFWNCGKLTTMICHAQRVPTSGNNLFQGTPVASATLYVPEESIDAYKANAQWGAFGKILPIPSNRLDDINARPADRTRYDLSGKRYNGQRGIYIQGGKKYVAR